MAAARRNATGYLAKLQRLYSDIPDQWDISSTLQGSSVALPDFTNEVNCNPAKPNHRDKPEYSPCNNESSNTSLRFHNIRKYGIELSIEFVHIFVRIPTEMRLATLQRMPHFVRTPYYKAAVSHCDIGDKSPNNPHQIR